MAKKLLGIDFKKDADALLMGAGIAIVLLLIPQTAVFMDKIIDKGRELIPGGAL